MRSFTLSCTSALLALAVCTSADSLFAQSPTVAAKSEKVQHAVAVIQPVGNSKVRGLVRFHQLGNIVSIDGTITGLTPGKHGFHVHQYGDLSDLEQGKSAGGHFNPTGEKHGRRTDEQRHVGDLGNIVANEDGEATIDIQDKVVQLNGPHSIIGRSIVIHQGEDKFTQPTGDAGARAGVGVIGIAELPKSR